MVTISTVRDRTGAVAELVSADGAGRRTLEEIAADPETARLVARLLRKGEQVEQVRVAAFNSYI